MRLYLVRHGEAKREEIDPARGLTDKGIEEVRKTGGFVKKLNISVGQMFHSGKTRAEQTANELAGFVRSKKGVVKTDGLGPLDDPGIWVEHLQNMSEDTMLVGHLPHVGKLAAALVCEGGERHVIDFKMAGIVCLQRFDDGHWAVAWMVIPELIR